MQISANRMNLTIDLALQQGIEAHKEGKLQEAERLYRAIIQSQPHHADANHNLGVLAVALGKTLEALPMFKQALDANPNVEQFWLSYIDALIKSDHYDKALPLIDEAAKNGVSLEKLKVFRRQASHKPLDSMKESSTRSTFSKRRAEKQAKKKERRSSKKVRPATAGCAPSQEQLALLIKYYDTGCFDKAESLAMLLTEEFPLHPFGWKILGAVIRTTGRLENSLPPLQKSVELAPQDFEAQNNLGVTLKDLGKLDEAQAAYQKALSLAPDYAEAHNNLGNTLKLLGRLEAAEASYKQAISFKPDYAQAHSNLGIALQELGRADEAEVSYRRALLLNPKATEVHRHLTSLKNFASRDKWFAQMQLLCADRSLAEENRCDICFALAKACDDLGDFASAFEYYAEGNALRKKQCGYDTKKDIALFKILKASHQEIAAKTLQLQDITCSLVPIFIIGMPRSGTTLVEQIISSHPLVAGAGELPFVSQFGSPLAVGQTLADDAALKAFREQYLSALEQRSDGRALVSDKMPQNFQFLGLIAAALPEAKIIHVKRDPAAVCWANYTQYFAHDSVSYCYSLDDILHYHELYKDLMKYWHQELPNRIYDLNYEALTEDQQEETRKLIDYLGLDWDDACLSPQENNRSVATASNMQVRQKVYQGSSEKWKRYRPYLNGALDHFNPRGP